jgi:hypothetical protein
MAQLYTRAPAGPSAATPSTPAIVLATPAIVLASAL